MQEFKSVFGAYLIIVSLIVGSVAIPCNFNVNEDANCEQFEAESSQDLTNGEPIVTETEERENARSDGDRVGTVPDYWFDGFDDLYRLESWDNITIENGDVRLPTHELMITTTEDFDAGMKTNVETYTDWAYKIPNASGIPKGELQVEYGDIYSDNFEGVAGQNLTEYDYNWSLSITDNTEVGIWNDTVYSGNRSLNWSTSPGATGNAIANRSINYVTGTESLILYWRCKEVALAPVLFRIATKWAGGYAARISLGTPSIYNISYSDGAVNTNTGFNYEEGKWYRLRIEHNPAMGTYDAYILGDTFVNETEICKDAGYMDTPMGPANPIGIELKKVNGWMGQLAEYFVDNIKIGDYYSSGIWESATQTLPNGFILRNMTLEFSGLEKDKQEIDSVVWLVNNDIKAVYDYDIENDTETPKTIESNELTSGDFADIDNNFTTRVYLSSDGNATPIIYQINNAIMRTQGSLRTKPIELPWNRQWGRVELNKSEPVNTSIKLTVIDSATGQSIQDFINVKGGNIDITAIDPIQFPKIELQVKLATNSSNMPVLHDYKVIWKPDLPLLVQNFANFTIPEDTNVIEVIDLALYFNDTYTPDSELYFGVNNESDSSHVHASINGHYLDITTPTENWAGNETLSINCSDGEFTATSNTFTINIEPINDAPIWLEIGDIYILEDTPAEDLENIIDLNTQVYDVDNNSDELNISIVLNTDPHNISVVIDDNNMIGVVVPLENYIGTAAITLRADDGSNYTDEHFNIIIQPQNDIPLVSLIYPDNRAILTSNKVEISWNAEDVEGAALKFDLYLTTISDAGTTYMENITELQVTIELTDGTYFWKVIPHDGIEYGDCISGVWEFSVDTTISTPTLQLVAPVYNSIVTTDTVELRWMLDEWVDSSTLKYEIYLDTSPRPRKLVPNHLGLAYTATDLKDGKTYYWTIIPKMERGVGNILGECISGVWCFKIDFNATQPMVTLLSPGNGKTIGTSTPTLFWDVEYQAASSFTYIIYLDTSSTPAEVLKTNHPEQYITTKTLENGKTYSWTVIPIAGNVMGNCSSGTWKFTVDTGAEVPEVALSYPIDDIKINNPNPTLSWSLKYSGSGTVGYDIYVDPSEPPTELKAKSHQGGTELQVALTDNMKYYWTVIPSVGNIEGICSSGIWSFDVASNYTPVFQVNLELATNKISLEKGQFDSIELTVTNNGDVDDLIKLEVQIEPTSLETENVLLSQSEINLASNNFKTLALTINIPKDTGTGDYKVTITASSQGALGLDETVYDSKILTVEVLEEGTTSGAPLYLAGMIILIIVVILLLILFIMTVSSKKKVETQLSEAEMRGKPPVGEPPEEPVASVAKPPVTPITPLPSPGEGEQPPEAPAIAAPEEVPPKPAAEETGTSVSLPVPSAPAPAPVPTTVPTPTSTSTPEVKPEGPAVAATPEPEVTTPTIQTPTTEGDATTEVIGEEPKVKVEIPDTEATKPEETSRDNTPKPEKEQDPE